MRLPRWQIRLVLTFSVITVGLYAVRWTLFPGAQMHNEMWRFLIGDIAFLFLQILIVTIVIEELIQQSRREELQQKLNMVIGAFFAEAGTDLLGLISQSDARMAEIRTDLIPSPKWTPEHYARARRAFSTHEGAISATPEFLAALRDRLASERSYLLGLITNQALLEHGSFTDLLWATTHVSEELDARKSLEDLPATDVAHLIVDIRRVFGALGSEWLRYMEHLQGNYPHLFSLAVRTNPLDPNARVEVTG